MSVERQQTDHITRSNEKREADGQEMSMKDLFLKNRSLYFENQFDIGDEEAVRGVMALDYMAFKGLLSTYTTVEIVDLTNDTYVDLGCLDYVKGIMKGISSTQEVLNRVVQYLISEEFKEEATEFYDMSTAPERLRARQTLTMDYNGSVGGWLRSQIIPISWMEDGRGKEAIVTVQRLHDNKQEIERLKKLSVTDGLSKLYNRAGGEALIKKCFQDGISGMLCLLDIDDFKHVNDTYGHMAGDDVLRKISACMKEVFRKTDLLVRIGGDEFLVFCPHVIDRESGENRMEELIQSIGKLHFDQVDKAVSVSIGMAFYNGKEDQSYEDVFNTADAIMYQQKKEKKRSRK